MAGIVRRHRGAIRVESAPGSGTTFLVYFPATSRVAVAHSSRPLGETVDGGVGTILVVDDEQAVRETATRALERAGFHTRTASNGREAVEALVANRGRFALVLMDQTMPEMNGYETFLEMKEIEPSIRVLLTSGYDEASMDRKYLSHGFAGFIQKPYRAGDLVAAVKRAIS